MSLKPANGTVRSDINVTPLVDVCLVLLVIFMVVTPLIQAGVKVDVPKTVEAPVLPQEQTQLDVTVQADGSVWIHGTRTAEGDLHGALAALHEAEPDRDVILRGDRHLQYEKISEVLTTLSDVGFTRIGLVTERKAKAG
jgi:biopolymer transport protein ExbD